MAIKSITSLSNTQVVLPKQDAEQVGTDDHSRQEGKKEQGKHPDTSSESRPVSNAQGQITGKFIDVVA